MWFRNLWIQPDLCFLTQNLYETRKSQLLCIDAYKDMNNRSHPFIVLDFACGSILFFIALFTQRMVEGKIKIKK